MPTTVEVPFAPVRAQTHPELLTLAANAPYWQEGFGGSGEDLILGMAADSTGNVYATGSFTSTLSLGGSCSTLSSSADSALFVAKFAAANGACVWAVEITGASGADDASGTGVAVDASGNVYVVGAFTGSLTAPTHVTSNGGADLVFAKIGSTGTVGWTQTAGGTSDDIAYAVALNGLALDVVGAFSGSSTFGGSSVMTSAGSADGFFAAYATGDGSFVGACSFGGPGYDVANAVGVDFSGRVWIAGAFSETASFGTSAITSNGGFDAFLVTYAAVGLLSQVSTYGGTGNDSIVALAIDSTNAPRVAGYFASSMTLGTALTGSGATTGFVAAFNTLDVPVWARTLDASTSAYASAIAVDASANVYVAGAYGGTGGGDLSGMSAAGATDFFLTSYSSSGTPRWMRQGGTTGSTEATALVATSSSIALGGSFSGSLNCGLGALTSAGMDDLFACDMPTSTLVVGDTSATSTDDAIAPGHAQAFSFTAVATGPVDILDVYVDATSTASQVTVGVYATSLGNPSSLLTSAVIASPLASAWNAVSVPTVSLTAGTTYWLAILVSKAATGTAVLRDQGSVGTASVTSLSTTLSTLPATWTTGTSGVAGPVSMYGAN